MLPLRAILLLCLLAQAAWAGPILPAVGCCPEPTVPTAERAPGEDSIPQGPSALREDCTPRAGRIDAGTCTGDEAGSGTPAEASDRSAPLCDQSPAADTESGAAGCDFCAYCACCVGKTTADFFCRDSLIPARILEDLLHSELGAAVIPAERWDILHVPKSLLLD